MLHAVRRVFSALGFTFVTGVAQGCFVDAAGPAKGAEVPAAGRVGTAFVIDLVDRSLVVTLQTTFSQFLTGRPGAQLPAAVPDDQGVSAGSSAYSLPAVRGATMPTLFKRDGAWIYDPAAAVRESSTAAPSAGAAHFDSSVWVSVAPSFFAGGEIHKSALPQTSAPMPRSALSGALAIATGFIIQRIQLRSGAGRAV